MLIICNVYNLNGRELGEVPMDEVERSVDDEVHELPDSPVEFGNWIAEAAATRLSPISDAYTYALDENGVWLRSRDLVLNAQIAPSDWTGDQVRANPFGARLTSAMRTRARAFMIQAIQSGVLQMADGSQLDDTTQEESRGPN